MSVRSGFEFDVWRWLQENEVTFEYEKESYELWLQYELRTDDITIIVIFIEQMLDAKKMEREFVTTSMRDLGAARIPSLRLNQADLEEEDAMVPEEGAVDGIKV